MIQPGFEPQAVFNAHAPCRLGFGTLEAMINRFSEEGCQEEDVDLRSSDVGLGQLWLTSVPHFLCVKSWGKLWSQAALASEVPCQHPVLGQSRSPSTWQTSRLPAGAC